MSHHYEYCYVIVNERDITHAMIEESLNSEGLYRKSLDGSKRVLKFTAHHPDSMAGYIKYCLEEILVIMNTADWSDP